MKDAKKKKCIFCMKIKALVEVLVENDTFFVLYRYYINQHFSSQKMLLSPLDQIVFLKCAIFPYDLPHFFHFLSNILSMYRKFYRDLNLY